MVEIYAKIQWNGNRYIIPVDKKLVDNHVLEKGKLFKVVLQELGKPENQTYSYRFTQTLPHESFINERVSART